MMLLRYLDRHGILYIPVDELANIVKANVDFGIQPSIDTDKIGPLARARIISVIWLKTKLPVGGFIALSVHFR